VITLSDAEFDTSYAVRFRVLPTGGEEPEQTTEGNPDGQTDQGGETNQDG